MPKESTERTDNQVSDVQNMKNELGTIRSKLDRLGTAASDSVQYKKMDSALTALMPKLDHCSTGAELKAAMGDLAGTADEYYYAKLEETHNERRSSSFECAREIREMMHCLEKKAPYRMSSCRTAAENKTRLKMDIAAKVYKLHQLSEAGKIRNEAEKTAEINRIKSDPEYRKAFYKTVGRIIKGQELKPQERIDRYRVRLAVENKTVEELTAIRGADAKRIGEAISASGTQVRKEKELHNGKTPKEPGQPVYAAPGLHI